MVGWSPSEDPAKALAAGDSRPRPEGAKCQREDCARRSDGAALYNWFIKGELKAEGNSITEGVGQSRVTKNLEGTPLDFSYQITDEEALPVLFDLIEHEGLVLGGSSGINIVGAMRLARDSGPGKPLVTILDAA